MLRAHIELSNMFHSSPQRRRRRRRRSSFKNTFFTVYRYCLLPSNSRNAVTTVLLQLLLYPASQFEALLISYL